MDLNLFVVGAACAVTLLFLAFIIRRRNQLRRHSPVLPYYSEKSPEAKIRDAVAAFEFEKYVVARFDMSRFNLFYWKGSRDISHDAYINPVLEFDYQENTAVVPFAIECRWMRDFENNGVMWATFDEIERYKNYERSSLRTVFVVIGVGGETSYPKNLFIVPLSRIPRHMEVLTLDFLEQFRRTEADAPFQFSRNSLRLV